MSLYLSPYVGAGTKANPFRPTGLDAPGASAIDVRLDATRADGNGVGWALLWQPSGTATPIGAIKIADDHGDGLTPALRTQLNNRTGLDFASDVTIQDAVETILLRPDTTGWKQLRPARGVSEAWLGSGTGKRRWVQAPVLAGGSITDNFNRADETPIAAPWSQLSGSTGAMNLSGNAITLAAEGDCFYSYASPTGWTADHSSQFLYTSLFALHDWGPAVRIGSDGFSAYVFSFWSTSPSIFKLVAGTFTVIETFTLTPTIGSIYKLDIAGSTLRYYENGVEHGNSPATDTSLTTVGNGPGVFAFSSTGGLDDFVATGEVVAGSDSPIVAGGRRMQGWVYA